MSQRTRHRSGNGTGYLKVRGAKQNNLKDIDLDIPLKELTVITGVSGSGKSSLAFDTIYAEGQRRYVETFSPYARQFLDRMDRPRVESIDGVPPAVAIDQVNPVRSTRSTVGTMTELNDHLKLLYSRVASLHCNGCGAAISRLSPEQIVDKIMSEWTTSRRNSQFVQILFPINIPEELSTEYAAEHLARQGYTRIASRTGRVVLVVQDRLQCVEENRSRFFESIESALSAGAGTFYVQRLDKERQGAGRMHEYSSSLRCTNCNLNFNEPVSNLFSFNSPVGACETCRGFGRIMGIDYEQVIPDHSLTLRQGAVKVFRSPVYSESYRDILRFAESSGIPLDVPWKNLSENEREWVMEGEGGWYSGKWYGVKKFFRWLERRRRNMHVRVFLSKYRIYTECPDCCGAQLKLDALNWRVGNHPEIQRQVRRIRHPNHTMTEDQFAGMPGLSIHELVSLPIASCLDFFHRVEFSAAVDETANMLLDEIRARLQYLHDVGLGYLSLNRQSRTLSGGEVQRINLTTALGTTLVNTLFVLDEPTIGLHSRDVGRVVSVLHRLRQAGNTLLVVEHEEQVIRAAGQVLDIGPGPGEKGGRVVHFGSLDELMESRDSVTARCLVNGDYLPTGMMSASPQSSQEILIKGARQHNLKSIDVAIPLNTMVCVTGVSGSGKSTLVEEVLFRGMLRGQGKSTPVPGDFDELRGIDQLTDVVMVSQAQIGKTTRSNPVSYVGALTAIRELLAQEPLAISRGYTAGNFSFNSDLGRCPTCRGTGFEHIEMQFLSDVYLRCPDCNGARFRSEICDVRISPDSQVTPKSIVEIMEMTVAEAVQFFRDSRKICNALSPLVDVGLEYLKLGQPIPTLSGGEAQRLKLAAHVAKSSRRIRNLGHILFLFDEPTTGLHFKDVSRLVTSLRKLIDGGNSVIVIEHNLDLISCADWVIDLGPEGGDCGGQLVAEGTPRDLAERGKTPTEIALRDHFTRHDAHSSTVALRSTESKRLAQREIAVRNARERNLKEISLSIPYNAMTVITGLSGSGKSTVAFDILFAEGQKRYLETINAYARQFVQPATRADFDAVTGIPPTVAIEQRTSRGGRRSTVATLTEVYHYIRLLFVRFGTQYCPDCDVAVESQSVETIIQQIQSRYRGSRISVLAPLVVSRKGYYTDLAKWANRKGVSHLLVDGELLPTDQWPRLDRYREHDIDMPISTVKVSDSDSRKLRAAITDALNVNDGHFRIAATPPVPGVQTQELKTYSTQRSCSRCARSFEELDPRLFSYNSRQGWCHTCLGTGLELQDCDMDDELVPEQDTTDDACSTCLGKRLNRVALAVKFKGKTIDQICELSISAARLLLAKLDLSERQSYAAADILSELNSRLEFLESVGLSYLALSRSAPTLSGGEAQRIRLAAQLGSSLCGACYVLDEPTIGLHSRDNKRLLAALKSLRDKGNTIVVVEHDEETITCADHIIDLGPGGGIRGGSVVATGSLPQIMQNFNSITGNMLRNPLEHPMGRSRPVPDQKSAIRITGAVRNNLKKINVSIPLESLVCVTGVSGSGKSTLVRDVLYPNLAALLSRQSRTTDGRAWDGCDGITGSDRVGRVLEVDQTPIGKTPRSCPATYVNVWQTIRKLFSDTAEARLRGYEASRFSFNVEGGRCEDCGGQGLKKIEMNFLPDVRMRCESCSGGRFNSETLAVRYRDKSIADVLNMSMEEAQEFFAPIPPLSRVFGLLVDVGLGYLTLGQQSPTLSGGEAQRIKLVSELSKALPKGGARQAKGKTHRINTLYILDEPTVGLHTADVAKLITVIHSLVDAGNTVVIIEHNLDIIAEADWIIDLGPEGGDFGGRVVTQGRLSRVLRSKRSHTASALREKLQGQDAVDSSASGDWKSKALPH
ncbi:MAG: excinuclease ABC subunit UvrA [Acidiferrobacterales bacterium]|nr:excinuclease ABC subunit UvrA [Acidiferrobacterales bacterium]